MYHNIGHRGVIVVCHNIGGIIAVCHNIGGVIAVCHNIRGVIAVCHNKAPPPFHFIYLACVES